MLQPPQDAAKLSNPSLVFEKTSRGVKFLAGTDFQGKLKADYLPATGELHIDTEVKSDPSPVVEAETKRAAEMFKFYEVNAAAHVADTQAVTGMMNSLISSIPNLIGAISKPQSQSAPSDGGLGAIISKNQTSIFDGLTEEQKQALAKILLNTK